MFCPSLASSSCFSKWSITPPTTTIASVELESPTTTCSAALENRLACGSNLWPAAHVKERRQCSRLISMRAREREREDKFIARHYYYYCYYYYCFQTSIELSASVKVGALCVLATASAALGHYRLLAICILQRFAIFNALTKA